MLTLAMSAGTVLVVEDNPITRRMVRLALEGSSYQVVEADDRARALEEAATRPPDLIITRDSLRDADGLALVEELRRRGQAPLAAIILWSKAAAGLEALSVHGARFTQFLASPAEPSRLLEIVRAYLPARDENPPPAPAAAFSRKQVLQPRILDLNSVVVKMDPTLRRVIGEDVQVATVLDEHLAAVRADAGQLEQVLVSLAVNARAAMPRGGHLIIETSDVQVDAKDAAAYAEIQQGHYVVLAVSDTGEGTPPEVKHVFEPVFAPKGPDQGTRLGLATVHGIVRQSDGHIFVYSAPGRGTTVKVYLPAAAEPDLVATSRRADAQDRSPTGIETILVAEDDLTLRELVCAALEASGYTVLQASKGGAAWELCERYEGPIDLLITDVLMPGIDGRHLAQALAALRPDMKVLYISAYTDDAVILRGLLTEEMPLLGRPIKSDALARKVRQVLDG
jgi:CheY-like chemotaxis protein